VERLHGVGGFWCSFCAWLWWVLFLSIDTWAGTNGQFTWELCFVKWGNCWFYFCGIFWYFDLQYLFHRQATVFATVFDWYSNKLSFSLNAVSLFARGGYLGFFGVPLIPKNFKFFLPTTTFLYVKSVK